MNPRAQQAELPAPRAPVASNSCPLASFPPGACWFPRLLPTCLPSSTFRFTLLEPGPLSSSGAIRPSLSARGMAQPTSDLPSVLLNQPRTQHQPRALDPRFCTPHRGPLGDVFSLCSQRVKNHRTGREASTVSFLLYQEKARQPTIELQRRRVWSFGKTPRPCFPSAAKAQGSVSAPQS